ncbi:MAG: PIN domain-containing protein [Planctomycetaceae bacterium]|nr:PIN domain-containing protein [Planctomycetaceae bacterium]
MTPVFLDTVGLIALWERTDQWRPAALAAFNKVVAARRPYVTTPLILLECGNAAARKPYRMDVVDLRRTLIANGGLIDLTENDWHAGWQAYEQGRPGGAGIVDCISFAVMRRLGLAEAFTNDQHFAAAGFVTLF